MNAESLGSERFARLARAFFAVVVRTNPTIDGLAEAAVVGELMAAAVESRLHTQRLIAHRIAKAHVVAARFARLACATRHRLDHLSAAVVEGAVDFATHRLLLRAELSGCLWYALWQAFAVDRAFFFLGTTHAGDQGRPRGGHGAAPAAAQAQAGEAGKILTKAILKAAGLTHQQHYRTEYKSEGGCDADFAFPHVPNNSDQDLDLIMAVQFSTNDRIRLASAELRAGVRKYLVTYNGIDSSSKTLKEIGDKHIKRCMDENIKIGLK